MSSDSEEKGGMVLSRYCKQRIVQLYFKWKVSYGRIAKVLAAEGLKVPKKTIWITIFPNIRRMELYLVCQEAADASSSCVLFPSDLGEQLLEFLAVVSG